MIFKRVLNFQKKLQITSKISFKFLLGGPPEIVRSPAPPSPKNTKKFYVCFAFLTYLMSPLCLSRSLSPWIIFWILTAPTIPWPYCLQKSFLKPFRNAALVWVALFTLSCEFSIQRLLWHCVYCAVIGWLGEFYLSSKFFRKIYFFQIELAI